MGTAMDVIHLDEEPSDPKIYSECLLRTMTTDGIIICTFTPLLGLSEVVLSFLPGGKFPLGGMGVVNEFA
jgi:phage terminase large subunit-like protein